jgi:hypothetical protein
MGASGPVARPANGVTCAACLIGVLIMGAAFWAGVVLVAESFLSRVAN